MALRSTGVECDRSSTQGDIISNTVFEEGSFAVNDQMYWSVRHDGTCEILRKGFLLNPYHLSGPVINST